MERERHAARPSINQHIDQWSNWFVLTSSGDDSHRSFCALSLPSRFLLNVGSSATVQQSHRMPAVAIHSNRCCRCVLNFSVSSRVHMQCRSSIFLSVTFWHCVKTANYIVEMISKFFLNSAIIPAFEKLYDALTESPSTGVSLNFRQITSRIRETWKTEPLSLQNVNKKTQCVP